MSHSQDLAVVVLLMLIPLLAPSNGAPTGFATIARALGIAALKVCPSMQAQLISHFLPWHIQRRVDCRLNPLLVCCAFVRSRRALKHTVTPRHASQQGSHGSHEGRNDGRWLREV